MAQAKNPITTKRLQEQFANNIVSMMRHDNVSLLQAYITLSQMMTSDEVIELAKAKIEKLNGGRA